MRSTQKSLFLVVAAALAAASAQGAPTKWESVAASKGDRIEIDKMRVTKDAEGRALAWTRLFLEKDRIDEYGLRYTAIEAYNRYDCEMKSFATLRRVYRRDAQAVREEPVAKPVDLPAEPGSIDDKLLTKACKEPATVQGRKAAAEAAKTAVSGAAAGDKPSAKYADMRSLDAAAKPKTQLAADAPAAAPAAAEKPAEARPRFIELPKIDKSQFQEAPKPEAKAAEAKPAETKPVAESKPAAKAAPAPVERPAAVSRRDYEMQLATSGPRKTAKKAAPEPAEVHRHIHWSYEGEGGPANWGKLEPQYAKCSTGQRQSPIDIREGIIKVDLETIKFDYKPTQFRVTDNGHTIQVDVGDGSSIKVMEREYQLVQFHFHKPSEERINGRPFEMVAHLVHKDYDGRLAVVAVLMEKGSEHPVIQSVWNHIPLERGMSTSPTAVIDLNQLLPDKRAYYTYMGSLTTPPCTEDVLWMVFKAPIQVSPQQLNVFHRLYPNNARPIQPTNGRLVKETR